MICCTCCGSGFFAAAAVLAWPAAPTDGAALADAAVTGVALVVAVVGGVALAAAVTGVAVVLAPLAGVALPAAVASVALGDAFAFVAGAFIPFLRPACCFAPGVALAVG